MKNKRIQIPNFAIALGTSLFVIQTAFLSCACSKAEVESRPSKILLKDSKVVQDCEVTGTIPKIDPKSPYSIRVSNLSEIYNFIRFSTEAFYRERRRIPASLEELYESGWLMFTPKPTELLPRLRLTNEPLYETAEYDNTVSIVFTPGGFKFSYVVPKKDLSGYRIEKRDGAINFADDFEEFTKMFEKGSCFTNRKPIDIRLCLFDSICNNMAFHYWRKTGELPENIEQLIDGKWEPREDIISRLPVVAPPAIGAFYFGACKSKNITYVEMVTTDTGVPFDMQRIYISKDPFTGEDVLLSRTASVSEKVKKEETVSIIDSSIPGWGFLGK